MGPITLTRPKLLLGEGKDEVAFFEALLVEMGLQDIQVLDYEGKTNFANTLPALIQVSGFRDTIVSLGITQDADDRPLADVTKSILSILKKNGVPFPGEPPSNWPLRVALFVLPDHHGTGMLEDLCLQAVSGNSEYPCLAGFFECIRSTKGLPPNMSKARAHAWLASQPLREYRLGRAAKEGLIPWSSPVFDPLKKFLAGL